MRAVFLTTEFGDMGTVRGGLGYYLARLTPMLKAAGCDCEVLLCSGDGEVADSETLDHRGVRVRRLRTGATPFDRADHPGQVRRHLRAAWTLADELRTAHGREPYDVVQVPNFGASGLFVDLAVPVVMRFSSHAPTWHRAAGARRGRLVVLSELLQRQAIRRADRHFAPSRFVAKLVRDEMGLPVEVIRPPSAVGTDPAGWDREWAERVVGGDRYLLHAGQLGRAKGTDIVLAAAVPLLAGRPGLHLHLCGRDAGAGSGIESLRDRFPGRVHYHGRVAPARLHPLMAGAEAVVAPSRADNLPNVVIEALSVGTPVVGVRDASIDELVVEGRSGALAPPEDPAGLAGAVERLLDLPDPDRMALAKSAARHVRDLLDDETAIGDMVDLFEDAKTLAPGRRMSPGRAAFEVRARLALAAYPIKARWAAASVRGRLSDQFRRAFVPGSEEG